jgi:hypothetical protein
MNSTRTDRNLWDSGASLMDLEIGWWPVSMVPIPGSGACRVWGSLWSWFGTGGRRLPINSRWEKESGRGFLVRP